MPSKSMPKSKVTKKTAKTLKEASREQVVSAHKRVVAKKATKPAGDGATSVAQVAVPAPHAVTTAAPPVPAERVVGMPKRSIRLRDPQYIYQDNKIVRILGKCNWKDELTGTVCDLTREIAPQDAFQVWLCTMHQRKLNHRKIAQRRKEQRAALAARTAGQAGANSNKAEAPQMPNPGSRPVASGS